MVVNEDSLKHLFFSARKWYSIPEIRKIFQVRGEEELKVLEETLSKLEEDAFIYEKRNEYCLLEMRDDLVQGKIGISKSGTGYVKSANQDFVVKKENLNSALDGDIVLIQKSETLKDGRTSGIVKKIIKRDKGVLIFNYENGTFKPYKVPFNYQIRLPQSDLTEIKDNMRILVKVGRSCNEGVVGAELIKVIGHKDDVDLDERTIAYENNFDVEFPENVLIAERFLPKTVSEEEMKNRLDLRNKLIFTIDSVKTKDIDDAISLEINERGNFVLGVHIAHVSHYVKENSPIFMEAQKRGTSVYMDATSIPMLPRSLSNGICSLNQGVDRLTRSVFIEIDLNGDIVDYKIVNSVINSKKKMDYDSVNQILEGDVIPNGYGSFKDNLLLMNKLSRILNLTKDKRGYLPFYSADAETVLDDLGNPVAFKEVESHSAEKLIENFMLLANEVIATYLSDMNYPTIYRTHDVPMENKMTEISKCISALGFKMRNLEKLENPKIMQKILKRLMANENFPVISNIILKGMQKAGYSIFNTGHYGLALDKYLHFTSPIRRFPDLEVHTCLDKIDECKFEIETINALEDNLIIAANISSTKEREADKAESEALAMHMAEYMEHHIGEYFNAKIIDIGSFGVLIKTDEHVIGRASFSDIIGDFYQYSEEDHSIRGRKGRVYLIGDNVRVCVKSASKEFRTVDYQLVGQVNVKRKEFKI